MSLKTSDATIKWKRIIWKERKRERRREREREREIEQQLIRKPREENTCHNEENIAVQMQFNVYWKLPINE